MASRCSDFSPCRRPFCIALPAGRLGVQGRAVSQRHRRLRRANLPPLPPRQPDATRPAARSRSTVCRRRSRRGRRYPITVTHQPRRDFAAAASRSPRGLRGGKQKGRQAGSWRLLDARAQLIPGAVGQGAHLRPAQPDRIARGHARRQHAGRWSGPRRRLGAGAGAVQRRRQRVEQRRLCRWRDYASISEAVRSAAAVGAGGLGLGG
mgnify:CR=1 FL=1